MVALGQQATPTLNASPTSLSFTYQSGAALPAQQSLAVRGTGVTGAYAVSIATPSSPVAPLWLTATPETGTLPASLVVRVNPTSLPVGTYRANITVQAGQVSTIVPVQLVVSQASATLTISPLTVSAAVTSGQTSTQSVTMVTSGGTASFTATAAGAPWLTLSPATGVLLPGSTQVLTLKLDSANLAPQAAPYTAKVTVVATGVAAANKSQNITVNLTVNSTAPAITAALWPGSAQAGSAATTITIRGTGFYKDTTLKMTPPGASAPVKVTPTLLSSTTMLATIPAELLKTAGTLKVQASNPGGDSTAADFTVSANPVVQAAVNLASYSSSAVSPGQLITLFGTGIGPATTATTADANNDGYADTSLNSVSVTIDGKAAPLLYVSQHQISVQVPYDVTLGTAKAIVVTNGSTPANGTVDIAAAAPAVFTLDGTGTGQAAALNQTGSVYTVNSTTTPAKPGDTVILYITGEGDYATTINPRTGYLIPPTLPAATLPQLTPLPTVTIGGAAATVSYAGPLPGSILGIMQINAKVPAGLTAGPADVLVTINTIPSQSGVTLSIHP